MLRGTCISLLATVVLCTCYPNSLSAFLMQDNRIDLSMTREISSTINDATKLPATDEPTSLGIKPISVGFLGCGTIASAIATGLATSPQTSFSIQSISVTRRSAHRSAALQQRFSQLVSVHDENQAILDRSDIIFLCLLPEQTSAALQSLQFDPERHTLISLVSTSSLEELCRDSRLPATNVCKMICLPAVADCNGLCLLQTPPPDCLGTEGADSSLLVIELCQALGGVVPVNTAEQMSALMVTTCLMGSFYGILRNNREFLVNNGVDRALASYAVGRLYENMVQDIHRVIREPDGFDALIAEQTPGGLNEQGLNDLTRRGVLDAYDEVQKALFSRIRGDSDV